MHDALIGPGNSGGPLFDTRGDFSREVARDGACKDDAN
jgi:S1-C subfamily serine protease